MPIKGFESATDAELVRTMDLLLRALGRFYMHLTEATLNHFGEAGEPTVRSALRRLGKWRGSEMRQAHNAMGKPINMETLMKNWDAASTYIVQNQMDEGFYSPNLVTHDDGYCPASEVWRGAEFYRWGHVYCDEFH